MCRNIKPLFNLDPPANDDEIYAASLQFVRKVSGFAKPSLMNEAAFNRAVEEIAGDTKKLLDSLTTKASPHDREVEVQKAHERALKRFGTEK